jgi:hypothetical protein
LVMSGVVLQLAHRRSNLTLEVVMADDYPAAASTPVRREGLRTAAHRGRANVLQSGFRRPRSARGARLRARPKQCRWCSFRLEPLRASVAASQGPPFGHKRPPFFERIAALYIKASTRCSGSLPTAWVNWPNVGHAGRLIS